ncbi:MAG: VOC family protein [Caulobacter sp.]|nr:VOC family protein [Caulobacter sp.]
MAAQPSLISALSYRDPRAALAWLETAFGFETVLLIEDGEGNLAHSQMRFGESQVMIGNEWTAEHRSPMSNGGLTTQTVHINLGPDGPALDDHCERARAAGAVIIAEPETQFYGDRTYRCKDPEGHIWTVSKTVAVLTPEAWDQASGLKTTVHKG